MYQSFIFGLEQLFPYHVGRYIVLYDLSIFLKANLFLLFFKMWNYHMVQSRSKHNPLENLLEIC